MSLFDRKIGRYASMIVDFTFGPNGSIGNVCIPVDDYYEILEARCSFTTAGTDGGGLTAIVEKLTGTQAPGGGANMLKTKTFNMQAAINAVQTVKRSSLGALTAAQAAATLLNPGDRIGVTFTGVLTALVGLAFWIRLKPTRPSGAQAH